MPSHVRVIHKAHLKVKSVHLYGIVNEVLDLLIHPLENIPVQLQLLNHSVCLLIVL